MLISSSSLQMEPNFQFCTPTMPSVIPKEFNVIFFARLNEGAEESESVHPS